MSNAQICRWRCKHLRADAARSNTLDFESFGKERHIVVATRIRECLNDSSLTICENSKIERHAFATPELRRVQSIRK